MKKDRKVAKVRLNATLTDLARTHGQVLIALANNVGSLQMARLRQSLRGKATIFMGKNTMMRRALGLLVPEQEELQTLVDQLKDNIGLIFCQAPLAEVRQIVLDNKVPAAARQGVVAPNDVTVYAGPTGLDPSQTAFFQTLGINTKVVKGQIEIQNDVPIIATGNRVTASEAVLLQKLNIRPFHFGMILTGVYENGAIYDPAVLDTTPEQTIASLQAAVTNVAAISRAIAFPTKVSVGHSLMEAYKNCMSLCIPTDFTFERMTSVREAL